MPPIDEASTLQPKPQSNEVRKPKPGTPAPRALAVDLVAFTVDAAGGRIVSIERVDEAGARRELSDEDRARLAKADPGETLRSLIERAFEGGIDCVLGEAAGEADAETSEDAELGRLLLQSLIARSSVTQLLQGEVLRRALVGTLIEYAANGAGGPPEGAVAH